MASHLYQLLYVSKVVKPFGQQEFLTLGATSQRNNAKRGITGILLLWDDSFLQALEGPRREVESLLKIIKQDPRHTDLTVLYESPISDRDFGQWTLLNVSIPEHLSPDFDKVLETLKELCDPSRNGTEFGLGRIILLQFLESKKLLASA